MYRFARVIVHSFLAIIVAAAVGFPPSAGAAVPSPQFMPGFPMIAGSLVMVMWTPVPGAVKYNIYMDGNKIGEAVNPPFQVPTPGKGGEYKLAVSAVDAAGAESEKSPPGVIRVISIEPPKDLSGIYDSANKLIALRWSTAPGAVIYNVFRSEKDGDIGSLLVSLQDVRHVDKDIQQGKKYFYRIVARDLTGKDSNPSPVYVVETKEQVSAGDKGPKRNPLPAKETGVNKRLMNYPGDIVAFPNGSIVVAMDALQKFETFDDDTRHRFNEEVSGADGLGIDNDGNLLVAQGVKNQVLTLASDTGKVLGSFSVPELKKPMIFDGKPLPIGVPFPFDAAQLKDGSYAVTDNKNNRLVILDSRGGLIKIAGDEEGGNPIIPNASYVAYSRKNDRIYAVSGAANTVSIFDGAGIFKGMFGGTGNTVGMFGRIQGLSVDADGNVWIPDLVNSSIQKFSPEGEPIGVVSNEKKDGPIILMTPSSVFVVGKTLYIAESMVKRMKRFELQ